MVRTLRGCRHDQRERGSLLSALRRLRLNGRDGGDRAVDAAPARSKPLSGRLDDPNRPLETVIDPELARRENLRVGSRLRMMAYGPDELGEQLAGRRLGEPQRPLLEFTVVGIGLELQCCSWPLG